MQGKQNLNQTEYDISVKISVKIIFQLKDPKEYLCLLVSEV